MKLENLVDYSRRWPCEAYRYRVNYISIRHDSRGERSRALMIFDAPRCCAQCSAHAGQCRCRAQHCLARLRRALHLTPREAGVRRERHVQVDALVDLVKDLRE